MVEKPDSFIPTRRSLLTRLKNWSDEASWRRFFDVYGKLIYTTAVKAGLTQDEAEEALQETIITVAKKFKEQKYRYDPRPGSFKAWLLHTTRWRINDQLRKRWRQERLEERRNRNTSATPKGESVPDPAGFELEALWEREWQTNLLEAATERIKRQVSPSVYQIFDLRAVKDWPARKVADALHVSLARVYYAEYKVSALVKKEVKRLETQLF